MGWRDELLICIPKIASGGGRPFVQPKVTTVPRERDFPSARSSELVGSQVNLGWSNISHMLHGTGIFTYILAEIYGTCSIHAEIWGIVSASYNACLVGDFFGNSVNYVLVIFKTFTKNVEKKTHVSIVNFSPY